MSGGHYYYKYYNLDQLADDIESDFINDGKYQDEDYSSSYNGFGKNPMIEYDRLDDATEEQRIIILKEVKGLIKDLRKCSKRCKELDWYMSGDTGADSYLTRMKNEKLLKK